MEISDLRRALEHRPSKKMTSAVNIPSAGFLIVGCNISCEMAGVSVETAGKNLLQGNSPKSL